MSYFVTEELLSYVAERSRKLKRLSIEVCDDQVREGLTEAVQKLPLLEELSLSSTDITIKGIEALGLSCPRLKSFVLSYSYCDDEGGIKIDNSKALAIADKMSNEGLQAILDGCPNLVSLDLRWCSNVSLNKVLRTRISQHIKYVQYPHDSLGVFTFSYDSSGYLAVMAYNGSSDDKYFRFIE